MRIGQDPEALKSVKPKILHGELHYFQNVLADLNGVQRVHLEMDDPPVCLVPSTLDLFTGSAEIVAGKMSAPIRTTAGILGIPSARSSYAWPTLGAIAGVEQSNLGEFTIPELAGSYTRPPNFTARIFGQGLLPSEQVLVSSPDLQNTHNLSWTRKGPLSASATIIDSQRQADLTNVNAGLGIAFGIGGSVLAAVALETTKRQRPDSASSLAAVEPTSRRSRRDLRFFVSFVGGISGLTLIWLLGRRR